MEWKTGLPEVSGEYVVYTYNGFITTSTYSAKDKTFLHLYDAVEKWIELDYFVKNYVLLDDINNLKNKEKELWTGKKTLEKVCKLDIPIKIELSGLDILKSVLDDINKKETDISIKAMTNKVITVIDSINTNTQEPHAELSEIKLSKFEFDLLSVINTDISGTTFEYHPPLMGMKSRGHFKDVDPKMKLEEILRDVVIKQ